MSRKLLKSISVIVIFISFRGIAQDLSKIEDGKYLKNTVPVNSGWSAVPDLVAIETNKKVRGESRKRISKNKNIEFYEKNKTQAGNIRTLQAARSSIASTEKVVVYNPDRKMLGILTGNFLIKVKNKADLELVTIDYGATIVKSYEQIGRAIIKFGTSTNIELKFKEIKQDPRIQSIEYDIVTDKVEAH